MPYNDYRFILSLTFKFFHILFIMLLYIIISMSFGIEGGYNIPAVGFNNLKSGTALTMFVNRNFKVTDITFSIGTTYYSGNNAGYSFNSYGLRCGFNKNNWRFSPVVEFGTDYVSRKINNVKETGYTFNYTIGLLINFHSENLRIYPKFYYEGITDFKTQAGFIGVKLGLGYEI